MSSPSASRTVRGAVLLASLGYFVDIYDLILFAVVRTRSLTDIGVSGEALTGTGAHLMSMQMTGMLLGGFLWGILGDKKGRLSVLFGSILMYSVANLANAFVHTVPAYAAWRLIAGIGLAGELGAGVTLVSELMSKETRGYGTMLIAGIGVMGAIAASLVAQFLDWRMAYLLGGVMGILLLLLRIRVSESGMFSTLKAGTHSRGDLLLILRSPSRLLRYLCCVGVGLPIWFVIGILVLFSPELGKAMGMTEAPVAGKAVLWCYTGLAIGDFLTGFLSQRLGSRRGVLFAFILLTGAAAAAFLGLKAPTPGVLYSLCFGLGVGGGYWAVFVTTAAEHFGTNLRATVATTAPNLVRGALVPMTAAFLFLKASRGPIGAAAVVGGVVCVLALVSLAGLHETHGKDLDFVES